MFIEIANNFQYPWKDTPPDPWHAWSVDAGPSMIRPGSSANYRYKLSINEKWIREIKTVIETKKEFLHVLIKRNI